VSLQVLPTVNAALNVASALLLVLGHRAIRRGDRWRHARLMVAAACTSTLFLLSYVAYHSQVGSHPFARGGVLRVVYLAILATHAVLAMAITVLVPLTLSAAARERFAAHRRLARITFPIWLYVSVTGVVVYWLLYRL
jgi:uncharacterized membrane protein YozB (DUF420 family)